MKKKKLKISLTIIVILCALSTVLLACEKNSSEPVPGELDRKVQGAVTESEFLIPNERNTFTHGTVVFPTEDKGPRPMVFICHGYRGTQNSGGAAELSRRLAEEGIVAVRIDFNSFREDDMSGGQTNVYTLKDMVSDATVTMKYVEKNYNIDTDRMGVYGRSMGGRVAMIMANEGKGGYDYKALALIAPAGNGDSMIRYMGGRKAWEKKKKQARQEGYAHKQGLLLPERWFREFEEYTASDEGYKFGDKPVLVVYNTLDNVVLPEASLECAAGYKNVDTIKVTTDDGHGYEMSYKKSEIKDMIMDRIVKLFAENL